MLSKMQFPGEDWKRFYDAERNWKIAQVRNKNANVDNREGPLKEHWRGFRSSSVEPIYNGLGQQVGTADTWHDREEYRTRRYYHGSPNAIPVGEYIIPGAEIARDEHPHIDKFSQGDRDNASVTRSVFSTTDKPVAAYFAAARGDEDSPAYLHEVVPERLRDTQPWGVAYQSDRAKVVRRWRIDDRTAPVSEAPEDFDPPKHEQLKLGI